ncbi:MAG: ABC transporter ATP-binding protein [Patescibacteria group bacterium]|jgi:ABC-type lipoprotein export system ATPase subunit|nr:ABC transporter ATP-binding protein [Patescibacteria group bacterium]
MPQPIIKTKGLEITYNLGKENEFKATRGVTSEIYEGEVISFFGPSGCGKSTIFYSILGILEPSAGELYVNGDNPYTYTPDQMVDFQAKTIGIIYQAFFLINSLSVIDNISLPLTFLGYNEKKRKKRGNELLERVSLTGQGGKFPADLSGGQMQRVSVARAMVNNPKILLADEPTGNLDSVSTKQVMDLLAEINETEKTTIILITHNAAQLMYSHRVFYMGDGKLKRIVPNPDKKQIAKVDRQKTFVSEMDQLSKMYPYDTPVVLKVKSLVNYLTQDISFDKIIRLEELIGKMVERKMGKDEFMKELSRKYLEGGVGLSESVSETMSEKVEHIINQSEDVRRYRRRFEHNIFFSKEDRVVNKLTKYVLEEYKGEMTPYRLRMMREAVRERISGVSRKEDFYKKLKASTKKGGVGFSKVSARNVTEYFEKLITQGLEVKAAH